jgi:putative transposase
VSLSVTSDKFNEANRYEVFGRHKRGLRRVLHAYVQYYLKSRTHLSLGKDSPVSRPVASPSHGEIVAIPQLGGLHHRYERRAA